VCMSSLWCASDVPNVSAQAGRAEDVQHGTAKESRPCLQQPCWTQELVAQALHAQCLNIRMTFGCRLS
jgi:hypothetical protein